MTAEIPGRPDAHARWVPAWLRKGFFACVGLVIVEYVVLPQLLGAGKSLHLLSQLEPFWLILALLLELGSWVAYAASLRILLRGGVRLMHLVRLVLATTGLSHVFPGGAAGGAGLGYELLTSEGIPGSEAGIVLATEAIGSAVVLNILLLLALLITIPLAGLHPVYVVVALLGLVALLLLAALLLLFTAGEESAVRAVRALGRYLPRLGEDHAEKLVRQIGDAVTALATEHRRVRMAALWSALNWLLDAGALWCCFAALGHFLNPVELFAAYGIANVLAVIPITPGGLGIIEASAAGLIVSFGTPSTVATLGVLGWRLMNFWLPIPLGAVAYLTRLGRHRPASAAPA